MAICCWLKPDADHAHHDGNAARALWDAVAYDEAVKAALDKQTQKIRWSL